MDEQMKTGETGDKNAVIDQKLRQFFDGKIVRKDLTKKIKEGANVPVYVLEFLLGQYCSSDDPEVIETGVENVKRILADNYVRPDEAQKILSMLRQRGMHTVIDKITVNLNMKKDTYEAEFSNLGIKNIPISEDYPAKFDRLLCGGIWCIVQLEYEFLEEEKSTSPKGTLSIEHIYDYLIVDEASQVDLATGVLAFSCARNIVIVGDLKQLPNVLTEDDIRTSDAIWQKYSLDERYRFSTHSLLSSALEIWQDAPVTLLREHYRCHPKIINFCNQKFYHGQLIVMTKDHDEPDVLTMYRTIAGNHARGHLNQRQIDVIQQEVLPRLHQQNFQSIGIITPYRDQVTAIRKQLGDTYEVDTVHKFQGREQDAIILTSVDNVITDFVDDPHMLNVAVSRAVHSLAVVTSQDPRNDQTNYGDLTRYIEYNNFEVIQSQVYSVFDMLYQGYAEQRRAYLQKHKRVSEYDSENLMYITGYLRGGCFGRKRRPLKPWQSRNMEAYRFRNHSILCWFSNGRKMVFFTIERPEQMCYNGFENVLEDKEEGVTEA